MFSLNSKIGKTVLFIIAVYFIYALLFIWNTSYTVNGQRYFSLLDDAMISMRYAANYAAGDGPYFNAGSSAKVEGYTNPLWMLIMTAVHLLPVAKQYTSLIIQLLAAILMSINLYFTAKLADIISSGNKKVIYSSIVLTAFFLPLNLWTLGGMETAALVPIVTASMYYLYLFVKERKYKNAILWLPAIGVFFRPDFLLVFLTIYFIASTYIPKNEKKFDRTFFVLLGSVIFLILTFRLSYYDDILPNTYYLKMIGYPVLLRITRGIFSFFSLGYIILGPLFVLWLGLQNKNAKTNYHSYSFLFIIPLVIIIYSIYIGGDAWDWWCGPIRFVGLVLPFIFIVFSHFWYQIPELVIKKRGKQMLKNNKLSIALNLLAIFVFVNISVWTQNGNWKQFLLLETPILMQDNKKHTVLALEAKKVIAKNAKVALATAGVIPYFLDREIIDILGKNDKTIAHIKGRIKSGFKKYDGFEPGHNKWDYSYSIGYLHPDAVVQLWTHHEEALPYLSRKYKLVNAGHFHFFIKLNKNY